MVAERGRQAFIFTLPVPPRDLLRPLFYLLCARQKTLSLLALFAPLSPAVVVCDDGDLEVCLVCYKCMLCMYVSCECARCAFACSHTAIANRLRRRAGGNLALIAPRLFCIFIGRSRRLLSAGICQQSADCGDAAAAHPPFLMVK
jgi:hypothetical protein